MTVLVAALSLQAAAPDMRAAVVTFDPPPIPTGSRLLQSYQEAGMYFYGSLDKPFSHAASGRSLAPDNGTGYLNVTRFYCHFRPTQGPCILGSVDLSEYSIYFAYPHVWTFTATLVDGSRVGTNFTTDGIMDGPGNQPDFQRFTFDNRFTAVVDVEISWAFGHN